MIKTPVQRHPVFIHKNLTRELWLAPFNAFNVDYFLWGVKAIVPAITSLRAVQGAGKPARQSVCPARLRDAETFQGRRNYLFPP
jgi:hypothetical protein